MSENFKNCKATISQIFTKLITSDQSELTVIYFQGSMVAWWSTIMVLIPMFMGRHVVSSIMQGTITHRSTGQ